MVTGRAAPALTKKEKALERCVKYRQAKAVAAAMEVKHASAAAARAAAAEHAEAVAAKKAAATAATEARARAETEAAGAVAATAVAVAAAAAAKAAEERREAREALEEKERLAKVAAAKARLKAASMRNSIATALKFLKESHLTMARKTAEHTMLELRQLRWGCTNAGTRCTAIFKAAQRALAAVNAKHRDMLEGAELFRHTVSLEEQATVSELCERSRSLWSCDAPASIVAVHEALVIVTAPFRAAKAEAAAKAEVAAAKAAAELRVTHLMVALREDTVNADNKALGDNICAAARRVLSHAAFNTIKGDIVDVEASMAALAKLILSAQQCECVAQCAAKRAALRFPSCVLLDGAQCLDDEVRVLLRIALAARDAGQPLPPAEAASSEKGESSPPVEGPKTPPRERFSAGALKQAPSKSMDVTGQHDRAEAHAKCEAVKSASQPGAAPPQQGQGGGGRAAQHTSTKQPVAAAAVKSCAPRSMSGAASGSGGGAGGDDGERNRATRLESHCESSGAGTETEEDAMPGDSGTATSGEQANQAAPTESPRGDVQMSEASSGEPSPVPMSASSGGAHSDATAMSVGSAGLAGGDGGSPQESGAESSGGSLKQAPPKKPKRDFEGRVLDFDAAVAVDAPGAQPPDGGEGEAPAAPPPDADSRPPPMRARAAPDGGDGDGGSSDDDDDDDDETPSGGGGGGHGGGGPSVPRDSTSECELCNGIIFPGGGRLCTSCSKWCCVRCRFDKAEDPAFCMCEVCFHPPEPSEAVPAAHAGAAEQAPQPAAALPAAPLPHHAACGVAQQRPVWHEDFSVLDQSDGGLVSQPPFTGAAEAPSRAAPGAMAPQAFGALPAEPKYELVDAIGSPLCEPFTMAQIIVVIPDGAALGATHLMSKATELVKAAGYNAEHATTAVCAPKASQSAALFIFEVEPNWRATACVRSGSMWLAKRETLRLGGAAVKRNTTSLAAHAVVGTTAAGGVRFSLSSGVASPFEFFLCRCGTAIFPLGGPPSVPQHAPPPPPPPPPSVAAPVLNAAAASAAAAAGAPDRAACDSEKDDSEKDGDLAWQLQVQEGVHMLSAAAAHGMRAVDDGSAPPHAARRGASAIAAPQHDGPAVANQPDEHAWVRALAKLA